MASSPKAKDPRAVLETDLEEDLSPLPPSDAPEETDGEGQRVGEDEEDELVVDESAETDDSYASDLDIGDHDLIELDLGDDDDESGIAGETEEPGDGDSFEDNRSARSQDDQEQRELDVGEETELPESGDDGGQEGTLDEEPLLDEGDLPALDADDGVEMDLDALVLDLGLGLASEEGWERRPQPAVTEPLSDGACAEGRIVAVGTSLLVVEPAQLRPSIRPLAEPAHCCAVSEEGIFFATDKGVYAAQLSGEIVWMTATIGVEQLAVAAQRVYARIGSSLLQFNEDGQSELQRGDVRMLSAGAGTLYVLTISGELLRRRGHDSDFEPVSPPQGFLAVLQEEGRLLVSPDGALAALSHGRAVVLWHPDRLVDSSCGERIVSACFAVSRGRPALLILLDSGTLCAIGEEGKLQELAVLAEAPEGVTMCWDAQRELLFCIGPAGLDAYGRALRH